MDREEILLKEYEICQSHNRAIASNIWLSTSIFMSINLTIFGGLLYALLQSKILIWGISKSPNSMFVIFLALLLAVAIVLILYGWRAWLQRTHHISYVNNVRMQQIEVAIEVNGESIMRKNWLVRGLDLMYGNEKDSEKIPPDIKNDIEEKAGKDKKLKNVRQTGFESLSLIVCTAIGLWVIAILTATVYTTVSLISDTQYIQLGCFWAFIVIIILVIYTIKRKYFKKERQA